jgi:hypothetical protein
MTHNTSGIQTKRKVTTIIFGDPQHHTLENRVFNAAVIMITFIGVCATLLNYFSGNPIRELIITLLATAVSIGFYIASRIFHVNRYLNAILVVIFLCILCVAWITNQGSYGSTLAYFFIFFVVAKIILRPPYDKLLLGISFIAVISLLLLEHFNPRLIIPYLSESHMFLDKLMSMIICMIVLPTLVHLILMEYQSERTRRELLYEQTLRDKESIQQALIEIKILRGILPVCSFCKKIRDENNEWSSMENYISSHSEAEFSHSFCPDCGRKHYPEFFPKSDDIQKRI